MLAVLCLKLKMGRLSGFGSSVSKAEDGRLGVSDATTFFLLVFCGIE